MRRTNSYPLIYKNLVCEYYFKHKGTIKIKDILELFKISNGTLYNWIKAYNNNTLAEKVKYTKKSRYSIEIRQYIKTYISRNASFDYKKLISNIKNKFNISISKSMIYNILKQLNITRKKFNKRIIPNKKKITQKINQFKKVIKSISNESIISIDETSIDTHCSSNYGWSLKGKRITQTYAKNRIRYTIISGISNEKIIHNMIIKGSANGNHFKQFLSNIVNKTNKSVYLLMDNARIHHSKIVSEYINSTEHKIIYNVPYCPEYNPIEMMFSKFKIMMRKNKNNLSNLLKNINTAFKTITKNDLSNYYNHSFNFR